MSTKLTFRRNKLGNRAVQNLQTKAYIYKKLRDQVDNIIDQFHLPKCIPNVTFKFISF